MGSLGWASVRECPRGERRLAARLGLRSAAVRDWFGWRLRQSGNLSGVVSCPRRRGLRDVRIAAPCDRSNDRTQLAPRRRVRPVIAWSSMCGASSSVATAGRFRLGSRTTARRPW